jgi:predicted RNA-binding protein (virulence factor B family)
LSKKAFKRAVGSLLKRGKIRIDSGGFVVVLPER